MQTQEKITPESAIAKFGLALESSMPLGGVTDDWPHISYQCRITRDGREVWSGPYKLGIGHVHVVDPYKSPGLARRVCMSADEEHMLYCMKSRPHANFKDKATQSSACAKLAIAQKVAPKLPDVLHSLLLDGSAVDARFEDWCAEYGYSDDSIKALDTFRECERIGKALLRAFTRAELEELREAFSGY